MCCDVLITNSFHNDLLYWFQCTQWIKASGKFPKNPSNYSQFLISMWLTKRNMQTGKKSKESNMFCPSRNGWIRWHFQQGFQAKFLLTYSCHVVGCSLTIPFGNLKTGHTGGGSSVEIKGSEHVAPKYYGFGSDSVVNKTELVQKLLLCFEPSSAESVLLFLCL